MKQILLALALVTAYSWVYSLRIFPPEFPVNLLTFAVWGYAGYLVFTARSS